MVPKEAIAAYSDYHTKPTLRLCGENSELLNIKAGGIYNYHVVLNVSRHHWQIHRSG
jgi:hypothetical protein